MCEDEKVIFDSDNERLAPLLEKWGIKAEAQQKLDEMSLVEDFDAGKNHALERPKIGKLVPQSLINYL